MFVALLLSTIHSGAYVLGIQMKTYDIVSTVGLTLDISLLLFMLMPYVAAIGVVKSHRRHAVNRYLLFSMLRQILPDSSPIRNTPGYLLALFASYEFIYINSFVNAVIFISVNTRCRKKLLNQLSGGRDESTANKTNVLIIQE